MQQKSEKQLKQQLHRIKGQLEGVERMIDQKQSCDKVVMQAMAARASLESAIKSIVEQEAFECEKSSNAASSCKRIRALASTLLKYT